MAAVFTCSSRRYQIDGRRREMGLGGIPSVSLSEARDRALGLARVSVRRGNPTVRQRTERQKRRWWR